MKKIFILAFGLFTFSSLKSYSQASLNYFNGSQLGTNFVFNWQTSSETNIDDYEILVGTICSPWTSFAAMTPGNGTTTATSNYSDTLVGSFFDWCYCFQLVAHDFSGNPYFLDTTIVCYNSSATNTIALEPNLTLLIYPNPLTGDQITIQTEGFQVTILKLQNSCGQTILSSEITDQNIIVDLSTIEKGIYLLQLIDKNGVGYLRKLIKE